MVQSDLVLQGNGHERDFTGDSRVYIFDMFNYQIYPGDFKAKSALAAVFILVRMRRLGLSINYITFRERGVDIGN
jgi:hypothetical protein